MVHIPSRVRIVAAICISLLIVRFIPSFLVSSPYIPTKEELLSLITLPSFPTLSLNITQKEDEVIVTPSVTIVPSQEWNTIPTNSPAPTDVNPTQLPIETATPLPSSVVLPSVRPTKTPTNIPPTPTSVPEKILNYSKLNALVANPPQIGCKNNTIAGCPYETLYQTPVDKGLGWATFYADEHQTGYNLVADVIHNNKKITMEAAVKFINDNFMEKQSHLTPEEAKKTGKVIGYAATRSPKDLWKIKYMFGIDDVNNPKARFIGRVMIMDCAAPEDWQRELAILTYSYKGWNALNWIIDMSKSGFVQLPSGISGQMENINGGRPGVILIDEEHLDKWIYK